MTTTTIPTVEPTTLRAICDVLAATDGGLSGSEIDRLLYDTNIDDPGPGPNKRTRLYDALSARQAKDRCANNVIAFVQSAMNPIRYTSTTITFERRRNDLNVVLALVGYELGQDGIVSKVDAARTLSEAEARARRLKTRLRERTVHPEVLRFCKAELLQDNYFHAVLEANKSIAEHLRTRTGLTSDGDALITGAVGGDTPLLAINSLQTDTHWAEQKGFANLLRGILGTFRHPTAHAPKIIWSMEEEDALDLLTIASYAHRKIEKASRTHWPNV